MVALKSGGRNIKTEKALDCIYGYGVGIDLTRRDLQIASRDIKRPWEVGKAFDHSAPCGPLKPASRDRPSVEGPHHAQGQRQGAPGRRSQSDDLERARRSSRSFPRWSSLPPGDIIMTGTPSGVAATVAGDKIECEIEGVGKLNVTIGPPLK